MRCKKSSSRLADVCFERLKGNIQNDILQDKIEMLPYVLINELFRRFGRFGYYAKSSRPLTVFVHAKVKKLILNNLNNDPIARSLLLDKAGDVCKNLRELTVLNCYEHPNTLVLRNDFMMTMLVIMNNPHLRHLDLQSASCTDFDLKFISTRCSCLEYLSLKYCYRITNLGMTYLCTDTTGKSRNLKIETLKLFGTFVTPEGCLVALSNLPLIKRLKPASGIYRSGIFEMLARELERGKTLPEIENIPVDWVWNDINAAISVVKALPTLRKLHVRHDDVLNIHKLLPHVIDNLTSLKVTGYYVSIEVFGRCFPLLRELKICFRESGFDIDEQLSTENVSFKHLRKLTLDFGNKNMFSNGHCKMLFANCQELAKLHIKSIDLQTYDLLFNILQWNPLSKLKEIKLTWCHVSCAQVKKLLELNALSSITIELGVWNELGDFRMFDDIRNYIDEFNLDVEFCVTIV